MKMKNRLIISLIGFSILLQSCCFGVKEKYLGNNLYLSEYDNVDRKILYQEECCAKSGVEIVPKTVIEIAYDSKWIIAKSENKQEGIKYKYWVIKHNYTSLPNSETIKNNTIEFIDDVLFKSYLKDNKINLKLKVID